ncbi:hypothetical protein D3C76_507670 [compost metagenome]
MTRPLLLTILFKAEQSASMTHLQVAMGEHGLDRFRQRDQAQQVGHGNPRLANGIGHLLLGQFELLLQALQGEGLFQRVEVFALDVLDQRHGNGSFVGHFADHGRDLVQASLLGGAPAALTGDDLEAVAIDRAHHDRLHHAMVANRVRELFQRLRVHVPARLVLATLDQLDRQVLQFFLVDLHSLLFERADGRTTEQCIQPTSETPFLDGHTDSLSCLCSA